MTHDYEVSGMTCSGCVTKVKTLLEAIPGVTAASVNIDGKVQLTMNRHIATDELQRALSDFPQYSLSEATRSHSTPVLASADENTEKSFLETYKPILLVFGFIFGVTLLAEVASGNIVWGRWMRHFMAGFFLVFSFFKMLDIPAFAASYSSYDLLAQRWLGWGYIYPFVELALGVLLLLDFNPLITNSLVLVVMGVSTGGVIQSLMAKRRFQCACLGAVFNLPMSRVTLFEDVLMVAMSGVMLLM